MENRCILKEDNPVHHGHLPSHFFIVQRILRHQHCLLQPLRFPVRSVFLILHRNLLSAILKTLQKFFRRIHNAVILHGILCDQHNSGCTIFVVRAGCLLRNPEFIAAGRKKDFFQTVMC